MRDTTERQEAILCGTARLVGTDEECVVASVRSLLHDEIAYRSMTNAVNPYGDGHAAGRTVEALKQFFAERRSPAAAAELGIHAERETVAEAVGS
jgi:UDP-N-acetylglucosamine 2-epimerase (non-hydrolysing)